MSAIPNRRQPAFKNGVKKQKLHNKSILNLEEIFKTGPKMPQQMSRTSPTTPWSWVWQQFGFLSQVFIPSLKTSGISQGFQLDKGVRATALQGDVLLPLLVSCSFPSCQGIPWHKQTDPARLGSRWVPVSHRIQGCLFPRRGFQRQGAPQAGVGGISLSPPCAEFLFLALTPSKPPKTIPGVYF